MTVKVYPKQEQLESVVQTSTEEKSMRFVFMPYALDPSAPFTDSYWENLGCEWFWSDDYLL